jgi:hypothetical protein
MLPIRGCHACYSADMHVNPCLRFWRVDSEEKKGRIQQTRY